MLKMKQKRLCVFLDQQTSNYDKSEIKLKSQFLIVILAFSKRSCVKNGPTIFEIVQNSRFGGKLDVEVEYVICKCFECV